MNNDDLIGEMAGAPQRRPKKSSRHALKPSPNFSVALSMIAALGLVAVVLAIDPRSPLRTDTSDRESSIGDGVCEDVIVHGRPTWQDYFSSLMLLDPARVHALEIYNSELRSRGEDPVLDDTQIPEGATVRVCAVVPADPFLNVAP